MKRQTLKRQIVIICFLLIIAVICSYLSIVFLIKSYIDKDEIVHNESMSQIVVDQINESVDLPLSFIKNVDSMVKNYDKKGRVITNYLETIQISYPYFEEIHLIDMEGIIINTAPYNSDIIGNSVAFEPYFLGAVDEEIECRWSEVYVSSNKGNPTVSVTIFQDDYIIAADLDLNKLPITLSSDKYFEEIYNISIVDKWGSYIVESNMEKVLERQRYPRFNEIVSGELDTIEDSGMEFKVSTKKIDSLEWYIILEMDQTNVFKNLQMLTIWSMIFWAIIVISTFFLLFKYFKSVSKDLERLKKKTHFPYVYNMSDEEIIPLKYIEFEEFNQDFDNMILLIKKNESEVNNLNTHLNSLVKERTYQLEEMNTQLEEEIMDKEEVQEKIQKLNDSLEIKVKERTKELEFINGVLEHEVEKAEEANKSKSKYLSIMSHEMRTPLNGISGFLQMLESLKLNKEQRELTTMISDSTKQLIEIINDVLDVEKFAAGKMSFSDEVVHLDYHIRKIIEPYKRLAKNKNIEMNLIKAYPRDMHIYVDAIKMEQIFNNLLSNAIKFTDQGSIDVTIKISEENQRIRLDFSVKDTGLGIEEATKPNLFKPFAQANADIANEYGGSGLGLTICKEIIQHYDGDIDYESSLDEGTNFYGHIYVLKIDEALVVSNALDVNLDCESDVISKQIGKILVAEDNIVNQKLMMKFFEKHQVDYLIAGNGEEAVEACLSEEISVVLMDCQMPLMDGFEATKKIRNTEKNRDIRIIAMTAYASEEDKKRCIDSGMDDFISKPVDLERLEVKLGIGLMGVESDNKAPVNQINIDKNEESGESTIEKEIHRLMECIHFDYETSSDLLHTFIKQMKTGIATIEQQVTDNDFDNASKKAHQLKGAAGAVRSVYIREAVEKMEISLKENDVTTVMKYIMLIRENPLLR